HLLIYVGGSGLEPKIQVEIGTTPTEYQSPYIIPVEIIDPKVKTRIDEVESDITDRTLIEKPDTGYPSRPDSALSVTWIGVNEPLEAEPFDEWREVEGFTYFTDFSEYELNSTPTDWKKE